MTAQELLDRSRQSNPAGYADDASATRATVKLDWVATGDPNYPYEARVENGVWCVSDWINHLRAFYYADDFTTKHGREDYILGVSFDDIKQQVETIETKLLAEVMK